MSSKTANMQGKNYSGGKVQRVCLGEVQRVCFKESDCIIMRAYRRLSTRITLLLFNTRVLPWHVTLFSFALAVAGSLLLLLGEWPFLIAAAVLLQASLLLDCVDGEIARLKGTGSPFGGWFDMVTDYYATMLFIGCAAVGQFWLLGDAGFLVVGIAALINFGMVPMTVGTRVRYVGKDALKPAAGLGKNRYIGSRALSVTVLTLGALLNQVFAALVVLAVVWLFMWVMVVAGFYGLVKRMKESGK